MATNTTDTTTFFPDTDSKTDPVTNSISSTLTTTTATSPSYPQTLRSPDGTIHIELTHEPLSTTSATQHTRSPTAGATVLFLGTTRSYFRDPSRPVSRLTYSAYPALALRTLLTIATTVQTKHRLEKIYVAHRLGDVAVAEESVIVAVSSAHRGAGWAGAEEMLEQTKERAEIWKREWFVDGSVEVGKDGEEGVPVSKEEVGVWRDNKESDRTGRRRDEERG